MPSSIQKTILKNFIAPFRISLGFTLVELMIAISIIAVMSVAAIGSATVIQRNGRDAQRQSDLRIIQGAIQQYYADQNKYPGTEALGASATSLRSPDGTKTYLNQIPKDPKGSAYFYRPTIDINQPNTSCSVAVGSCHYYYLCANMEGASSGGACTAPGGTGNNYQLTPL